MNYTIMHNGREYGPYTLADLQRYVAAGNILVSDLVKSEGMEEWVPVSQVVGNIPVPLAPAAHWTAPPAAEYPPPPGLHWGILLAIDIVTFGLFGWAWVIVQAVWVRKVQPASRGLFYVVIAVALFLGAGVLQLDKSTAIFGSLCQLGAVAFWLVGVFSMRSSIEEHFNNAEPIGLQLSGVMTFFFNVIYFQYHFTQIARVKKAQQLSLAQHA